MSQFENWPDDILVGHHHIVKHGTFSRVTGGGELAAGQVVSEVDGKWYRLAGEIAVANGIVRRTNTGGNFPANGVGAFFLPNGHIAPKTLTITATDDITDNGNGVLVANGAMVGAIDYVTGTGTLHSAQAGLATAAYRHGDADGKSIPCGILVGPITLSATKEVGGAILRWGEYARRLTVFAGNPSADEKERMFALLEAKGFFRAK